MGSTVVPQPLAVHKDKGRTPRLIQNGLIISINGGNPVPGLSRCTEVGTVTFGVNAVTQRYGVAIGVWGGMALLEK